MNNRQLGATLPLVLFLLVALLGMAALAIDIGMMDWARQRAQNVADAAALAGGQALSTSAAATGAVNSVVTANNASGATFQGVTVGVSPNNSVTVQGYVNAPLSFAPAVGYAPTGNAGTKNTVSVSASATVASQNACGLPPGTGVAPFGLIGDDPNSTDTTARYAATLLSTATNPQTPQPGVYQSVTTAYGQPIILKLNQWDSGGNLIVRGNCDPLITSSSGKSSDYLTTIRTTSNQTLSVGQTLPTLTGNDALLSQQGLAARLSPSNTQFTHLSATYNLWFNGHQEQTEGHLLVVPIVSQGVKDKPGSVTVLAWTAFWVDQPDSAFNWIAHGRFLGLIASGGVGGTCTGAGEKTPPRLIQ